MAIYIVRKNKLQEGSLQDKALGAGIQALGRVGVAGSKDTHRERAQQRGADVHAVGELGRPHAATG